MELIQVKIFFLNPKRLAVFKKKEKKFDLKIG